MRCEYQPWDDIRISIEIVDLGTGITGLTVEAYVLRTSNGQYLQTAGGWGASAQAVTLTAISASNMPGLYGYSIGAADLSPDNGHYLVRIVESTYNVREHLRIVQTLSAADQRKMLNLRNRMKFKPTTWDSTSKQPTAGQLYTYETDGLFAADAVPDGTGAEESWDMTATFSSGQLTLYTVKPT